MRLSSRVLVRRDRTRREILEAVCRLICEEGCDAVTLARVAERVGMDKSTVYHYCESKEELLLAAVEHAFASLTEQARGAARRKDTGAQGLEAFLRSCVSHISSCAPVLVLGLRELERERERERLGELALAEIRALLRQGVSDGSLLGMDEVELEAVAWELATFLCGIAYRAVLCGEGRGDEGTLAVVGELLDAFTMRKCAVP